MPRTATTSTPSTPTTSTVTDPADELHALKATLTDLQSKRLGALRLYQEEKSRRVAEAARAADLAARLDALSAERSPPAKPIPDEPPASVIHTDFFVAEVRSLGLAQGGPSASLTWHCLAMTDLLACPPQIVVVAERRAQAEEGRVLEKAHGYDTGERQKGSVEERISSEKRGSDGALQAQTEEIMELKERLRRAEDAATEAKRVAQQNEGLIADLKAQLDASTAACEDLLETVKEQEDIIEKLS